MERNVAVDFIKVTTEEILKFIASAKKKIIFAKPAFLLKEVEALYKAVKVNSVECQLYMEAGDGAIRYGFGETSALELMEKHSEDINIHIAGRIRIAVLIVDEKALVYMPNIAFIEEETIELAFPNGLLCNQEVSEQILSQFDGKGEKPRTIGQDDNVIIFPKGSIPTSNIGEVNNNIVKSLESLKKNPAIDPAKLRMVNFYRNNYKILKIQVSGVKIENKRINLKPFYTLLPDTTEKLISSWSILTREEIEELQDTLSFEKELDKLKENYKSYIFNAGRFGLIIDVKIKDEFAKELDQLKEDFKSYLQKKGDDTVKKRFGKYQTKSDSKELKTILDESREQLKIYLLQLCRRDDDFILTIFAKDKQLNNKYEGKIPGDDETRELLLKEFVEFFVFYKLDFTSVDEIINSIDIKKDILDISDEMIFENPDFERFVQKYNLDLRNNSTGFEDVNN